MNFTYCMRDINAAPYCGVLVVPPLTNKRNGLRLLEHHGWRGSAGKRNPRYCSRITVPFVLAYIPHSPAPPPPCSDANAFLAPASRPRWEGRGMLRRSSSHNTRRRASNLGGQGPVARTLCPGVGILWGRERGEDDTASKVRGVEVSGCAKGSLYGFSVSYRVMYSACPLEIRSSQTATRDSGKKVVSE